MDNPLPPPNSPLRHRRRRTAARLLFTLLFLSQLQPLVILALGGIDGSFGIRPTSHRCLGLQSQPNPIIELLPEADFDFTFILFHFRYTVHSGYANTGRQFCIGQDIWFGE